MRRITEYIVIQADSISQLEQRVNEAIGDGMQPQGGVHSSGGYIFQAMVKYEDMETLTMQFDEISELAEFNYE